MKNRLLLTLCTWLAFSTACAALPAAVPSYKISTAQLQHAMAQRFPMRYPVAGLLELTVKTPHLRLLPERNRLVSEVEVEAGGPALRRNYTGAFDLEFALRYEPSDQSIRAHQLQVRSLRLPGVPGDTVALLQAYLPELAREAMGEVVLHKLRPQDLALPEAMGLQPDTMTVEQDGVLVRFSAKQAP
jgi:hypothetical protein